MTLHLQISVVYFKKYSVLSVAHLILNLTRWLKWIRSRKKILFRNRCYSCTVTFVISSISPAGPIFYHKAVQLFIWLFFPHIAATIWFELKIKPPYSPSVPGFKTCIQQDWQIYHICFIVNIWLYLALNAKMWMIKLIQLHQLHQMLKNGTYII